jgi:chloramphenicol O-acetyltransferase type A
MALSIEVHHALMDGLHVGRLVQALEARLQDPARWVGAADPTPGGPQPGR